MTTSTPEKSSAKPKKERSTAYPAIVLEKAIEFSQTLVGSYGKSPFSRESALEALKINPSGPSFMKISALVHYGLLDRSGNAYKNSPLAERIAYFQSEEDKTAAVIEAALRPKLFSSLVSEYRGRAIPTLLKNILIGQKKINRNVAEGLAGTFKSTMEFAGICQNDIISAEIPQIENVVDSDSGQIPKPSVVPIPKIKPPTPGVPAGMQSITLPSGIIISYSAEMAYLFALGKFADQISRLEEAIKKELNKKDNAGTDENSSTE